MAGQRFTAVAGRGCPFPARTTWAVYKVGALWRVLRPSRAFACHEIDAWAGDFATQSEALAWATNPQLRADWLAQHDHGPAWPQARRIAWIEGLTAECVANSPRAAALSVLFDPERSTL